MNTFLSFYTFKLDSLFTVIGSEADSTMDYSRFSDLFIENTPKYFRSFGEAILAFIYDKTGKKLDADSGWEFIKSEAKKANFTLNPLCTIDGRQERINSGSWKNWFEGIIPTKKMPVFAIAFILGLDEGETRDFIRKSCFRRPIDYRDKVDCVCFYCIRNKRPWSEVVCLLNKVEEKEKSVEKIPNVYSSTLQQEFDNIQTEEELTDYCAKICGKNQRLQAHFESLCKEIRGDLNEEEKENEKKSNIKSLNTLMAEEKEQIKQLKTNLDKCFDRESIDTSIRDDKTLQTLINIIVGYSITRENGISSIMPGVTGRIKDGFPVFTNDQNPNEDRMRKTIILLESYKFWKNNKDCHNINRKKNPHDYQYLYQCAIDYILKRIGVQELYYGDPWDALFLCCAYSSGNVDPVEKFRWIMDVLINDKLRKRIIPNKKGKAEIDSEVKVAADNDDETDAKDNKKSSHEPQLDDSPITINPEWKKDWVPEYLEQGENNEQGENKKNPEWDDEYKSNPEWKNNEDENQTLKKLWKEGHPHYKENSDAEKELLRLAREEHKKEARDELLRSYYRYVIIQTKKYCRDNGINFRSRTINFNELIYAGIERITEKILEYNAEKATLSTFLTYQLKWELKNTLYNSSQDQSAVSLDDINNSDDDSSYNSKYNYNTLFDEEQDIEWNSIKKELKNGIQDAISRSIDLLCPEDKDLICYEYGKNDYQHCESLEQIKQEMRKKNWSHDYDAEDLRRAEARLFRILRRDAFLKKYNE